MIPCRLVPCQEVGCRDEDQASWSDHKLRRHFSTRLRFVTTSLLFKIEVHLVFVTSAE